MVYKRAFRVTPTIDEGLRAKEISLEMIASLAERALHTAGYEVSSIEPTIAMSHKDEDEVVSLGVVTVDSESYGFQLTRNIDETGVRLLVELESYGGTLF